MEVDTAPIAKYVSQKINKVRWQPVSKHVIHDSTVFATGSWDNDENKICIWSTENKDSGDQFNEGVPRLLCEAAHRGDVTDLVYLNSDHLLTSSSSGGIHLYRHHSQSQTLSVSHSWDAVHRFPANPCPCTGLARRGEDGFASVGEDGRMCVYNIDQRTPTRVYEKADSCTLNAVLYVKQTELAAVNSTGQLKVWDTRQQTDQPARLFLPTGEKSPLHCVDKHPTQPHIVVTGGEDGALSIWDMRQEKFPVTLLAAHSTDMWEVHFHETHPDNLFTCSQDGAIWHWDASAMNTMSSSATPASEASRFSGTPSLSLSLTALASKVSPAPQPSAWLASEASKHRMEITDLLPDSALPANSISIVGNTLVCGTDAEQIVLVRNLVIK